MTWALVIALALAAFAGVMRALRGGRAGWEAILAALLLGLAGYAVQGRPDLPAARRAPDAAAAGEGALMVDDRRVFSGSGAVGGAPLILVADAFVRHGDYAAAADILQGEAARDPGNAEAWLALGNALVAQAGGALSPAALYAYRQAQAAAPAAPGTPYFLGLALAGAGQFDRARALWAGVLVRAPAEAKWRPLLTARLARLDRLIAMQGGLRMGPVAGGGPAQVDGPGN